jgi:Fe-S-cluster containining protein
MATHVRHVFNLLRDGKSDSPCSKAVAHVTSLFDRTAPANPLIACRKGCAHCCTQKVVLTAPEAFFVAARIKQNPRAREAVLETHRRTHAMSLEGRLQAQIFCALLEESICSIYTARPLACHAFVSTDLEACLAAFTRNQSANIPMPNEYVHTVHTCRILLMAALRIARLPSSVYEMNAALAVILTQENAEARWLAGENILAGVPVEAPPPPQFEQAIRQMAVFTAQSL